MAIIYEVMTTSLIPNTVMWEGKDGDVLKRYRIQAADGYVLHDKNRDYTDENGVLKLGYTTALASMAPNYDFTANPREFYAVPVGDVPADQIFGVGKPEHEIM